MVFSITDIDVMHAFTVHMAKTLWKVKLNLLVGAIDETDTSISNNANTFHCLLIDND